MAILRPETGTTYTLKLKYKSAMEKPGKWGVQFLYTLSTGDLIYLPPIAHQEIESLHLSAQEPFLLTKKATGTRTVYVIERVPQPPAPAPQPEKKPAARAELLTQLGTVLMTGTDRPLPTRQVAASTEPTPITSAPAKEQTAQNSTLQPKSITDGQKQFYLSRTKALVDVFAETVKYAAEHHGGVVTKDDCRAILTTIFINCTPKPGQQRSY